MSDKIPRWKQMSVHDIVTECAKYSLLECQEVGNREDMICSSLVHSSSVFSLIFTSYFMDRFKSNFASAVRFGTGDCRTASTVAK